MTIKDFEKVWADRHPKSAPISHTFRYDYPERWFRIHSLPKSRRYPQSEDDWIILLERQNTIMTDIFGNGARILMLTGNHYSPEQSGDEGNEEASSMKEFVFHSLDTIDLNQVLPAEYDKGQIFKPAFCETHWSPHKFDAVLRDIAVDAVRVLFVSVDTDDLIIPYDGGVDLIMTDADARDRYKLKYQDWLSERKDGL